MEELLAIEEVKIDFDDIELQGYLTIPESATGLVIFAHGSGSGRFSSRNRFVASSLNESGLATLLFDLLTLDEQRDDELTRQYRFDLELLSDRLIRVIDWAQQKTPTRALRFGLFGSSTGAAAALVAAANRPEEVEAVVSRGGRPDLAMDSLGLVYAPTLLIVGGYDHAVIEMNRAALAHLECERKLDIIPGATHLFEEAGKLENVALLAARWFNRYLSS